MPSVERRLAAIMFTDMVGYTALAQLDERKALELLEIQRRLFEPICVKYHGRVVKTIGDGTLIEFPSALEAVLCAQAIQIEFRRYNTERKGQDEILLRVGIHLGDVIHDQNDVYGDAVNIASRIEPLAEPGGICVSEQVFGQVRGKINADLTRLPPQKLKNVQVPLEIYKLTPLDESSSSRAREKSELASGFANIRRISTGIKTLDAEIGGGIPDGTSTLIFGAPKTGKSVFCFQFLMESIRSNQPCLYVMTDYAAEELARSASSFGWDIDSALRNGLIRLIDMTSTGTQIEHPSSSSHLSLKFVSLSIADLSQLIMHSSEDLRQILVKDGNGFRVVLDSITPLFIYNPPMLVAKLLRQFIFKMKTGGSLGIIVTYVEGSLDPQSELIIKSSFDNLVRLSESNLFVEGMIGTPKSRMACKITNGGLKVGY
jgi:class 3 adenylate cyclase/KaiC/GvpD/RAD55 family RecA-like ATPase